jgi:hypothetical protein
MGIGNRDQTIDERRFPVVPITSSPSTAVGSVGTDASASRGSNEPSRPIRVSAATPALSRSLTRRCTSAYDTITTALGFEAATAAASSVKITRREGYGRTLALMPRANNAEAKPFPA